MLAIRELLQPNPDDLAIDLGCGSGVISAYLGSSGAQVIGVDESFDAISFARDKFSSNRVSFQLHDIVTFELIECKANKIFCLECIEHIPRYSAKTMLQKCAKYLAPDGHIFMTTPNYRSIWPMIEYVLDRTGLVPHMDGTQHVTHYNRDEICRIADETGYEVVSMRSMCLISPWLNLMSHHAAVRIHQWEIRRLNRWGPILAFVLRPKWTHMAGGY